MSILENAVEDETQAVPGVELVLTTSADDSALDTKALRLIGVAQKRTLDRRRAMLQRRSVASVSAVADPLHPIELDRPVVVDLVNAADWDARLLVLRNGVAALADDNFDRPIVVRTRGWDVTEPGVLVDSRATSCAVFDVAVMVAAATEQFRRGEQPFVFLIPEPDDGAAAKLWTELITLVEDRLGIDRGTIRYSSRIVAAPA